MGLTIFLLYFPDSKYSEVELDRLCDESSDDLSALQTLLKRMCSVDVSSRPSASDCLKSEYFTRGEVENVEKVECVYCCSLYYCNDGVQCSENHFICKVCFLHYISSVVSSGEWDSPRWKANNGCMCSIGKCTGVYQTSELANTLDSDTFEKVNEVLIKLKEQALVREFDLKLKEERAKLASLSSREFKVLQHANHIRDEILTLKCPVSSTHNITVHFTTTFSIPIKYLPATRQSYT